MANAFDRSFECGTLWRMKFRQMRFLSLESRIGTGVGFVYRYCYWKGCRRLGI